MVGMSYFGQVLAPDRDQALTYQAIEEFGKVERLYPGSPYVERAAEQILACRERLAAHEFVIGGYYYQKKSFIAAADRFRVILDRYPHFARTEETLFLLADCLTATANPDEARLYYQRLVKEFPDGKFGRAARNRLQGTGNG